MFTYKQHRISNRNTNKHTKTCIKRIFAQQKLKFHNAASKICASAMIDFKTVLQYVNTIHCNFKSAILHSVVSVKLKIIFELKLKPFYCLFIIE